MRRPEQSQIEDKEPETDNCRIDCRRERIVFVAEQISEQSKWSMVSLRLCCVLNV